MAIAEAHSKGIVHRDLKPSNLFLARATDGSERIKVLDFGISKQVDGAEGPVTRAHDVMGSPNYMAPEQICAPLSVDARADIWALGAILVELATGKRAFSGDTITAVYTRVLTGEPELPEPDSAELPNELVSIVSRCLRKEPAERFQSVHQLIAALAPFAPPASAQALRAIACFGRTVLEGPVGGSGTATYVPSPFSPAAASVPTTSGARTGSSSGARSSGAARANARRQGLPGWIGVGVGLGLLLSAGVIGLPVMARGGGTMSVMGSVTGSDSATESELVADSGLEAETVMESESVSVADSGPEVGLAAAAVSGGPAVRVVAAAVDDEAVGLPRDGRAEVRASEGRPAAAHGAAATEPSRERAPQPSVESRRSADAEPPQAPSRRGPAPNPWDVTTFGGRS